MFTVHAVETAVVLMICCCGEVAKEAEVILTFSCYGDKEGGC